MGQTAILRLCCDALHRPWREPRQSFAVESFDVLPLDSVEEPESFELEEALVALVADEPFPRWSVL